MHHSSQRHRREGSINSKGRRNEHFSVGARTTIGQKMQPGAAAKPVELSGGGGGGEVNATSGQQWPAFHLLRQWTRNEFKLLLLLESNFPIIGHSSAHTEKASSCAGQHVL